VWAFIRFHAVKLVEIQDSHAQTSRYWDRPTDFADATLVYLAERELLSTIFTVDHADFETYRIEGRRRFRVLPSHNRKFPWMTNRREDCRLGEVAS
jgi:hypothetical protein